MPRRRLVRACLAVGLCLVGLTSCTSSPHYAQPTIAKRKEPAPVAPSSSSQREQLSPFARSCLARKASGGKPVIFFGRESQRELCGVVWSSDVVRSCSRLAYGAKVIAFVHKHKCGPARRTLATVYAPTFSVNYSSVSVTFAPPGTVDNPTGTLFNFSQVARPRRADGLADLLRAGDKIPGAAGKPANAYYGSALSAHRVDLFYDWYGNRPKSTHFENSLRMLGSDLAFTPLAH